MEDEVLLIFKGCYKKCIKSTFLANFTRQLNNKETAKHDGSTKISSI